ncbi:MAG: RNA polymerase sigma factor [Clostridia bacterium]|nr:RNA polymerase sigma factor [Clostridia bacterium]
MEQEFFEKEAAACVGMLYRVAYTILRNDADCQDAVQDALLKAWARRGQLKNKKYFRTWLVRILINASHDILRKRKRTAPLNILLEPSEAFPDFALSEALSRLPEKLRVPLMLCYSENLTHQEISRVLHIPVTTVQSRLRQGKSRLRKELKEDEA